MVWLVGEALLCTDAICRKKKQTLFTRLLIPASFCLMLIENHPKAVQGRLWSLPSFHNTLIPLSPSSSSSFNIPEDNALNVSSPARQRFDAPRCHTNPLSTHTHMLKSVANVMEFTPRFAPTRTSHTSRSPFHHDAATDKAKAPKGRAAAESDSSSSSLCSYIIGNNYGDVMTGGGLNLPFPIFFSFSFFSVIFTPNLIGERHQANVFQASTKGLHL